MTMLFIQAETHSTLIQKLELILKSILSKLQEKYVLEYTCFQFMVFFTDRETYIVPKYYFYRRIQRRVFKTFCPPIKVKGCFPSLTMARDRQSPYKGGHVTTPRGVCVETTRGRYVAPSAVRDHSSSILFSLINRVIIIMHS